GGPQEHEIGDGGRAERAPKPDALPDETQSLLDRDERGRVRLVTSRYARTDRRHGDERGPERRRIDAEREPRTAGDQRAPKKRPREPQGDRANEPAGRGRRRPVPGR